MKSRAIFKRTKLQQPITTWRPLSRHCVRWIIQKRRRGAKRVDLVRAKTFVLKMTDSRRTCRVKMADAAAEYKTVSRNWIVPIDKIYMKNRREKFRFCKKIIECITQVFFVLICVGGNCRVANKCSDVEK